MQFLEGGAGGPNGRDSRTVQSSDQDPADADSAPGHGSLMSRYRGTPPTTEDQATPPRTVDTPLGPLPAPGARPPTGASEDDRWRRSNWTPAPPVPPVPPVRPAPPAPTPPAATPPPATTSAPAPEKPAEEAAEQPADKPSTTAPAAEEPAHRPATTAPPADEPADKPADVAPATPATKPAGTVTPAASTAARGLLSAAESAEFRRRWRDLQADFVDDPQRAVRGAGDLSRQILQALADTIADAERVDRWKAEDGTSGTEDLRVALRQYRTLVDRLLEL